LSFSKLVEPAGFFPKLVDPACELCEWVVSKPLAGVRGLGLGSGYRVWGGFDSAVRWRSRAGSTSFHHHTLVELTCELCEWVVSKPW